MHKAFYILIFLIVVFLIQGIYYLLGPKAGFIYKILGASFIAISLLLIFKTNLQLGVIESQNEQYQQLYIDGQQTGNKGLHEAVVEAVLPETDKYVGLVVAAVADDKKDITGFGSKSLDTASIPTQETMFEIGSVSKVFTATLLARIVKESKLSLKHSITDFGYLPRNIKADKKEITLEQLVTHTSGLPRMSLDIYKPTQLWSVVSGGNPYAWYTEDKMYQIFKQVRLKNPAKEIRYSNIGYGLLGLLLENYANTTYQNLIQEKISQPLNLQDTTVRMDDNQTARFASGYQGYFKLGKLYLAKKAKPWDFATGMQGAGSLRSTGQDMLRFLTANMQDSEQKLTKVLKKTHQTLKNIDEDRIGMGWFIKEIPDAQQEIIFHNGITGGYAAFIAMTSDYRFGVVVLSSTSRSVSNIGHAVLDKLMQN